jgi:MarR family transcriptional regulator for hemolysin
MGRRSAAGDNRRMNDLSEQTQFGYTIVDVARLLRRVYDRRSMHLGLTRAQWRAMHYIRRQPGMNQTELAEVLDLEAIAVGRVVDRLAREGLVERREDPADRRRWQLFPAGRFEEMMASFNRIADALTEDMFAGIDPAQLAASREVFEKVRATLLELDLAGRNAKR